MSSEPRIARASFADGARWLIEGANLVGRGGSLLLRAAAWLIAVSLIQIIPLIGPPLLILFSPVLTAGMLGLFRRIDEGTPADPMAVFDGFRVGELRTRLLVLGGVLLAGLFLAMITLGVWLSAQMPPEALDRLGELMADSQAMEQDPGALLRLFEGVNVIGGLAIAAGIFALVLGALYFSVPLVFFWRWPVLAGLLWSLRALLANWLAFLGYGLLLVGLMMVLFFGYLLIGGLITVALGAAGQLVIQILTLALSMLFQLILAAAQWKAFQQVFPSGGPDDSPDRQSGDPMDRGTDSIDV